jgi:hypothetical protein
VAREDDQPTRYELVYTTPAGHSFVCAFDDEEPKPYSVGEGWTEYRTPAKKLRLNDTLTVSVEVRER